MAMTPVLIAHVSAGGVGLISGMIALLAPKGERLHRAFGTVFFVAMLTMGALGAYIATTLPQRGTIFIGVFVFYLVATAWMTVRQKENTVGWFEYLALATAIGITAVMVSFGIWAASNPKGLLDSLPAEVHCFFAALAALAAATDLNMILRGGVSGRQRIARHLWRMCLALVIAAFSFFLGQQKVMPAFMQGSPALFAPPLIVLVLMLFWLIRVRLTKWYKPAAVAP